MCHLDGTPGIPRQDLDVARRSSAPTWTLAGPETLDDQHEVWAHCPHCHSWFVVEDPRLDSLLLCPADLHRADATRIRLPS
jgi:hypothetical protein